MKKNVYERKAKLSILKYSPSVISNILIPHISSSAKNAFTSPVSKKEPVLKPKASYNYFFSPNIIHYAQIKTLTMIKSSPHNINDPSISVWNIKSSGKDWRLIIISIVITESSSVSNASNSQNIITAIMNSVQHRDRKEEVVDRFF